MKFWIWKAKENEPIKPKKVNECDLKIEIG